MPQVPVAGPPVGRVGAWVEIAPPRAKPEFNRPRIHALGDRVYLLIDDVLYRSDDHGEHWAERSRYLLDDFALLPDRVLGWTGNDDAPLMVTTDDGQHWKSRPVETYEGDLIESTGAPRTPVMLRVLGGTTVMVSPDARDELQFSDDPPRAWATAKIRLRDDYVAWAESENRSTHAEVEDATAFGGALYACAANGVFRSQDRGRTWDQLPSPTGKMGDVHGCAFATFDDASCVALEDTEGGSHLFCTRDGATWAEDDDGLYAKTAQKPEWQDYLGIGALAGSAEAPDRYFVSVDGKNPYADNEIGLFETAHLGEPWTRVEALRGVVGVALVRSSSEVLAIGFDARRRTLRLFRRRFR